MENTQSLPVRITAYRVAINPATYEEYSIEGWSEGVEPITPWQGGQSQEVQEEHEAAAKLAEQFVLSPNAFTARVLLRKMTKLINRTTSDTVIWEDQAMEPTGVIWVVDGVAYPYFVGIYQKLSWYSAFATFHQEGDQLNIDVSEDAFERCTGIDDTEIDFEDLEYIEL